MKRFYPLTFLSLALSAASLAAAGLKPEFRLYALIAATVSGFVAQANDSKYSPPLFQFTQFFTNAGMGLCADLYAGSLPWFSIMMFLIYLHHGLRNMFMGQLTHVRHLWIEPLIMIVAAGIYLYANMNYNSGWAGWGLPGVVLLVNEFFCVMVFFDAVKTRRICMSGFKAEIGKPAPDFRLNDEDGNPVTLNDFKEKRHLLLIFVRGDWCPSCHIMLRTYQRNSQKFKEKNIMLLGVGPDPVGVNRQMVDKMGLDFKILSDERQEMAKAFGIQIPEKHPAAKFEEGVPLPASFLIDMKGIVRYTSRPDRLGEFLDPETIFPVVQSLN